VASSASASCSYCNRSSTFAFSIILMGESWNWLTPAVCAIVIVLVWLSKRI